MKSNSQKLKDATRFCSGLEGFILIATPIRTPEEHQKELEEARAKWLKEQENKKCE